MYMYMYISACIHACIHEYIRMCGVKMWLSTQDTHEFHLVNTTITYVYIYIYIMYVDIGSL